MPSAKFQLKELRKNGRTDGVGVASDILDPDHTGTAGFLRRSVTRPHTSSASTTAGALPQRT